MDSVLFTAKTNYNVDTEDLILNDNEWQDMMINDRILNLWHRKGKREEFQVEGDEKTVSNVLIIIYEWLLCDTALWLWKYSNRKTLLTEILQNTSNRLLTIVPNDSESSE